MAVVETVDRLGWGGGVDKVPSRTTRRRVLVGEAQKMTGGGLADPAYLESKVLAKVTAWILTMLKRTNFAGEGGTGERSSGR